MFTALAREKKKTYERSLPAAVCRCDIIYFAIGYDAPFVSDIQYDQRTAAALHVHPVDTSMDAVTTLRTCCSGIATTRFLYYKKPDTAYTMRLRLCKQPTVSIAMLTVH